jgi:hypothetical protein
MSLTHNGGKHVFPPLTPSLQGWLSLQILHNFQSHLAELGGGRVENSKASTNSLELARIPFGTLTLRYGTDGPCIDDVHISYTHCVLFSFLQTVKLLQK